MKYERPRHYQLFKFNLALVLFTIFITSSHKLYAQGQPLPSSADGHSATDPTPSDDPIGTNVYVDVANDEARVDATYSSIQANGYDAAIKVHHLDPVKVYNYMTNAANRPYQVTFVIAHRGRHLDQGCAENTLCAIADAYRAGADGIELDVKTTADNGVVFGHDYTIGRELVNWTGVPEDHLSKFNLFKNFPNPDPVYAVGGKPPFGINYTGNNDVNNPKRSTLKYTDIEWRQAYDQFNKAGSLPRGSYQASLWQALRDIEYNHPMMLFLDVKNLATLKLVGAVINQYKRSHEEADSTALKYIFLKLGNRSLISFFGKLNNIPDGNEPGAVFYDPNDISRGFRWFWVGGTSDLDYLANVGCSSSYDCSPADLGHGSWRENYRSVSEIELDKICPGWRGVYDGTMSHGCLGVELVHKYENAPTQYLRDAQAEAVLDNHSTVRLAGFETDPQYDWYINQSYFRQKHFRGNTYPRTDGSCCFKLQDVLNSSTYLGRETKDFRWETNYNVGQFNFITSDWPDATLKRAAQVGHRPNNILNSLDVTPPRAADAAALASVESTGVSDIPPVEPGTYFIGNVQSGMMMDVQNSALTQQALVVQNPQNPALQSQQWSLQYQGNGLFSVTNVNSGMTLDQEGSKTNGTAIDQSSWSNSPNELWSFSPQGDGTYAIINQTSGYGLNVNNNASGAGTTFSQQSFAGTPPQRFVLQAVEGVHTGVYRVYNKSLSIPLDQTNGAPVNTEAVTTNHTTGGTNQQWMVEGAADNLYKLINMSTGMPLQINNASGASGAVASAFMDVATDNELWRIEEQADGSYNLINHSSGMALDGSGYGAPVTQASWTGASSQKWLFEGMGASTSFTNQIITGTGAHALPAGATKCALGDQGLNCDPGGPATVYYGDLTKNNGNFVTQFVNGAIPCALASFGGTDPAPGIQKTCLYIQTSTNMAPPPNTTLCGSELRGASCSLPGSYLMYYGANNYYFSIVATGTTACSLSNFAGDPNANTTKACYAQPLTIPVGAVKCATESGTCTPPSDSTMLYGAYKSGSSGLSLVSQHAAGGSTVSCSVAQFGSDPQPGVAKSCYYLVDLNTDEAPAGYTACAVGDVGQSCNVPSGAEVVYGADTLYSVITATGPFSCQLSTFGTDPNPGVAKGCWVRYH